LSPAEIRVLSSFFIFKWARYLPKTVFTPSTFTRICRGRIKVEKFDVASSKNAVEADIFLFSDFQISLLIMNTGKAYYDGNIFILTCDNSPYIKSEMYSLLANEHLYPYRSQR